MLHTLTGTMSAMNLLTALVSYSPHGSLETSLRAIICLATSYAQRLRFVIGETGIGKTLIGLAMAGGIASGIGFLKWPGCRRSRVMYLDGELPRETFKERMELIAKHYGDDLDIYGYNREDLGDGAMPPLNTDPGQAWLWAEIEFKPDVIFFDSIMCLLSGSKRWLGLFEQPIKALVCKLSAHRIAQVWFNHANEIGKSFGTKTREWEMDTVLSLSKPEDDADESAIRMEFRKARLRTPETADQFAPLIIHPNDWQFQAAPGKGTSRRGGETDIIIGEFLTTYDMLSTSAPKTQGLDGNLVCKVSVDAIRDELKSRAGFSIKTTAVPSRRRAGATCAAQRRVCSRRAGLSRRMERYGSREPRCTSRCILCCSNVTPATPLIDRALRVALP